MEFLTNPLLPIYYELWSSISHWHLSHVVKTRQALRIHLIGRLIFDISAHILKPLFFSQRSAISGLWLGALNKNWIWQIRRITTAGKWNCCNVVYKKFSLVDYSNSNTLSLEYLPVKNGKHYLFVWSRYCDLSFNLLKLLCKPECLFCFNDSRKAKRLFQTNVKM